MTLIYLFRLVVLIAYTVFVSTLVLITIPFHRTGKIYHTLARFHARGVLALSGVKVTVTGAGNVDLTKNYVYVSNHASHIDIPIVLDSIPQDVRLVYKKELEKLPVFGWGLRYGKTFVSIDRGQGADAVQTLGETAKKIRDGSSVLLFAEGTRSPDGRLQPFKRGPFNLALRAGIPVIPVTILGSHRILPRGSWKVRSGRVSVIVDPPVATGGPGGREEEFLLRDRVFAVIAGNFSEKG